VGFIVHLDTEEALGIEVTVVIFNLRRHNLLRAFTLSGMR
jgi:hypothetical protein